jgi:hypothetical protein
MLDELIDACHMWWNLPSWSFPLEFQRRSEHPTGQVKEFHMYADTFLMACDRLR